MSEKEILKKYGDLKMVFCELDRHRAKFKSLTGNVVVTFVVEYGDTIYNEMLLSNIINYIGYDEIEYEIS